MSVTHETRTPPHILGEDIKPGDTLLRAGEHLLIYEIRHELRPRHGYAPQNGEKWVTATCVRTVPDHRGGSTCEHIVISFPALAKIEEIYNENGVRALRDRLCVT